MVDSELIAALTPLVLAVVGLVLQYLKSKDTSQHGDAFITMLKKDGEVLDNIAVIIPAIKPYVTSYKTIVSEADKIWNSGGFTADDIKLLQQQYTFWKMQFDMALVQYRALRTAVSSTTIAPPVDTTMISTQ